MGCAENLSEAKNALHSLMMAKGTSQQVVEVTYNGRSKKYQVNATDEADLKRYISDLELECGSGQAVRRGSVRFYG